MRGDRRPQPLFPALRRAGRGWLAVLALTPLLLVGCGDEPSGPAGKGWPAIHGDARNSNTSPVTGSRELQLAWSRPMGAPIAAYTTIASTGQIFVTTAAKGGCNLISLQMDSGRKRFCAPLNQGAAASAPLVDSDVNAYTGEAGAITSFNALGQPRWRTPVVGTPISALFTGDGRVLFITQLGEVDVVERQTGERAAPRLQLLGDIDPIKHPNVPIIADDLGLKDCFAGAPACPVANTPALDTKTGRFYITLWRPFAPVASLVALQWADGKLSQLWSKDLLPGGSATSPVLSADGSRIYVHDNKNRLHAVDASNGELRWSYDLRYAALGSPAVSDSGLIVPAAGPGSHLMALQDKGDKAEIAWERKDFVHRGVAALAAGGTGYAVVAGPDAGLTLVTFDTSTGAPLDRDVLPGARGTTVGTSIGPKGEVLAPTLIGELFVFTPPKK